MDVARSPASPMPHCGCGGRVAVALGRGRGCRRPARIAWLALAVNRTRGSDRSGQQLRGVAAGRAEIERDDAGANADEGDPSGRPLHVATSVVLTLNGPSGPVVDAAPRARSVMVEMAEVEGPQ